MSGVRVVGLSDAGSEAMRRVMLLSDDRGDVVARTLFREVVESEERATVYSCICDDGG